MLLQQLSWCSDFLFAFFLFAYARGRIEIVQEEAYPSIKYQNIVRELRPATRSVLSIISQKNLPVAMLRVLAGW